MPNYNSPWNKGKIGVYSEETLNRMSEARRSCIPWNKGIPHSKEAKDRMSEARRGKCIGRDNPNWKGGVTSLIQIIRCSFEYRQWRSDVFTRDDFTCQKCGQVGGELEAHHKKTFSSILQKYEITNIKEALNCAELWNINNGNTLCKKCHDMITFKLKVVI